MGLPGDLGTTVLTGKFLDPAGNPMRGTVTIAPNSTLTDATGNVIIPQLQRAYQLFNGTFTTAPLVGTDNTDINPSGWTYQITVALQEVPSYQFNVALPSSGSPVDLSTLSPAQSIPELAGSLPVTGGTLTGKLTLTGSTPLQIPAGAAAGDVLTSDSSGNAAWGPAAASALTPVAVVNHAASPYSAAARQLIPADTTAGNVTVTLPSAPADLTVIGVKHVIQGGTNTVTVACGGSDVLNKTGGATSLTLTLLNQGVLLQYKASGGIWYVTGDDLPLAQLDNRYRRSVSIAEYGATTGASDNGPAINAAVTALGSAGGTVYVPPGIWNFSTALSLQSARSVTFEGQSNPGGGATMPSELVWTGTGSGSAVNAQNSNAIVFRNLTIFYTSGSFTGNLIDYRNVSGSDTSYGLLENCYIGSLPSTTTTANSLVNLDKCINMTIRKCNFAGAVYGIYGKSLSSTYSNVVQIENCVFHGQLTAHIWNAGQGWLVKGCTFEQLAGGTAGAYGHDSGNNADGLTFIGCWSGDSTGGTVYTVSGESVNFYGNWIGATSGTGIYTDDIATGLVVIGNDFVTTTTALQTIGSAFATGWAILGNTYTSVTTKLSGALTTGSFYQDGAAIVFAYGLTMRGNLTVGDGNNIILGALSAGSKIGTATTQKIGFWNATPIAQPSATGTSTGFTANSGTAVQDASTFTGGVGSTAYRISDIVLALKSMGLLAQ